MFFSAASIYCLVPTRQEKKKPNYVSGENKYTPTLSFFADRLTTPQLLRPYVLAQHAFLISRMRENGKRRKFIELNGEGNIKLEKSLFPAISRRLHE